MGYLSEDLITNIFKIWAYIFIIFLFKGHSCKTAFDFFY